MTRGYIRCIYGAGRYGKIMLKYLNNITDGCDYFVQSQTPGCERIEGVPIISLKEMVDIKADKLIFIAMDNTKIIREIEKNIYDSCSSDNKVWVYNCRGFIKDNFPVRHIISSSVSKQCVVCGNGVEEFCPWGIDEEIFLRYHIVGGGYRKNCKCPHCGAIDRERWLYYVLENHTDISKMNGKILHFAPEVAIESYIRKNAQIDYYSGDIVQGKAMHIINITDIPYKDAMFDYVISNHILEHIMDEEKAISEIKRVLKKDGKWIFSFPVCMDIKTYEDEGNVSPEQRLRAYGQVDHVRLYGNDFVKRFERYGLKLNVYSPRNELSDELIDKYGFIKDDIIVVARIG